MKTNQTLAKVIFLAFVLPVLAHAQMPQPENMALPALPLVRANDANAYAFVWDGAAWQMLPRNEARILDGKSHFTISFSGKKQLIGKLLLDGCYKVPAVSGENVTLAFRSNKKFKTFKGMPEDETGIEVTRLDCTPGAKRGTLIRTAHLERLGEAAATFGDKRETITITSYETDAGYFWIVQVGATLTPGRYALYLPDRAFEFEVK